MTFQIIIDFSLHFERFYRSCGSASNTEACYSTVTQLSPDDLLTIGLTAFDLFQESCRTDELGWEDNVALLPPSPRSRDYPLSLLAQKTRCPQLMRTNANMAVNRAVVEAIETESPTALAAPQVTEEALWRLTADIVKEIASAFLEGSNQLGTPEKTMTQAMIKCFHPMGNVPYTYRITFSDQC